MGYLLVVAAIALLILIHEAGHFIAARLAGMPVARFSLGFGPVVWSYKRGETEYCLSAIPLGGYVLLAVDEQAFFNVPLRKRIVFALGGPLANVLATVALLMVLNLAQGAGGVYGILIAPWAQTWQMTGRLLEALAQIATRPDQLSGLIGIVAGGGKAVGASVERLLQFSAVISLNLAVFNLLPIPVLDGGRVVLGLLEKVHPRAVRLVYVPLCILGALFLLSMMTYATVVDILRLAA